MRRNNSPKDVHTLIHGNCEELTLHGKRDFANMIKVKDLEIRSSSWNI